LAIRVQFVIDPNARTTANKTEACQHSLSPSSAGRLFLYSFQIVFATKKPEKKILPRIQ